jgi:hypothetical protein
LRAPLGCATLARPAATAVLIIGRHRSIVTAGLFALFLLSCAEQALEPAPPVQLTLNSLGTDATLAITLRSCSRFATEFGPYDSINLDLAAVDPANTIRVTDTAFAMNVVRLRAEFEKRANSPDVINRGDVWLEDMKAPRANLTAVALGIALQTNPSGVVYRFKLAAAQMRDMRKFLTDLDARCDLNARTPR